MLWYFIKKIRIFMLMGRVLPYMKPKPKQKTKIKLWIRRASQLATVLALRDSETSAQKRPQHFNRVAKRSRMILILCLVLLSLGVLYLYRSNLVGTAILYYESATPSQSAPNASQIIILPSKNSTSAKLNLLAKSRSSESGCPRKKPALIGILTTTDPLNTARRQILRKKYSEINRSLAESNNDQIDVVFFFGTPMTVEGKRLLQAEQLKYPEDVVVANIPELRDDGKILEWFLWARDYMYSPHDVQHGEWCPKYRYIGKGDDDSVIHLERLSRLLRHLPASNSVDFVGCYFENMIRGFIVKGMSGMLYLLSWELVEWIKYSPIPRTDLHGIEDIQVAVWLQKSKINLSYQQVPNNQFHDYRYSKKPYNWYDREITNETVVVHYCKQVEALRECVDQLYHGVPPVEKYGKNFTRSSISQKYIGWKEVKDLALELGMEISAKTSQLILEQSKNVTTASLTEYKHTLLANLALERAKSVNIPLVSVDNYMVTRLDEKQYHTIDRFIAERAFVQRMGSLGIGPAFIAATELSAFVAEVIKLRPLEKGEFDLILTTDHVSTRLRQLHMEANTNPKEIAEHILKLHLAKPNESFDFAFVAYFLPIRRHSPAVGNEEIRRIADSLSDYATFNETYIEEVFGV
ncbi:hypothetical protein BDR26DRAFT_857314, partial [Obelidium mucronatum]